MTPTVVSEHEVLTTHGLYHYAVEESPCGYRALVYRGDRLLHTYRWPTLAQAERWARRQIIDGGPIVERERTQDEW